MERDSFVFYRSFAEALKDLDETTRVHCYDAIADYALNGNELELFGIESAVFKLIKPQIDANNRRFENGLKGGRPKNQTKTKQKPNRNQTETKPEPNVNVNVNDNVNVNENDNENVKESKGAKAQRSTFKPPTLDEVKDYCWQQGYKIDESRFVDFYASKGWMVGKNKMKDWKAAVRNWAREPKGQDHKKPDNDFFRRMMNGI